MLTTLDELIASAKKRVAESKRSAERKALERAAELHVPRGFRTALMKAAAQGPAIIAELKKASPSKGIIRDPLHVGAIASGFEKNGAAALSVLTEEQHFKGSLANLCEASAATELPCLRKDFIVDEFQILEARANRADAVLLIVAALQHGDLVFLADRARDWGLDVMCEVHDEQELERAKDMNCDILGVNSRDLKSFHVDLGTAIRLAPRLPASALRVAESGIRTGADITRLQAAGYQGFLIGESLMQEEFPGEALARLLRDAAEYSRQVSQQ